MSGLSLARPLAHPLALSPLDWSAAATRIQIDLICQSEAVALSTHKMPKKQPTTCHTTHNLNMICKKWN